MLTALENEDNFPRITKPLIDRLESICPEKCPTPDMTTEAIHHYAGKRAIVNLLIELHNDQNNIEK